MNFLYILLALVVLMVLITVHEFGHFIAGKIFGFKINEFSIGFGPKLYQKKNEKTGEIFSVRLLPLGGYCAFEGEDEENPSKDAFNNKEPWKRLIVLISGVLFNFIFGVIASAIFLMVNGYALPVIADFSPNNLNQGLLQKGDIITEINGKSIEAYRSMSDILKKIDAGENITIKVKRDVDGKQEIVTVSGVQKYKTNAFFFVADYSKLENSIFTATEGAGDTLKGINPISKDDFIAYVKTVVPVYNEDKEIYESKFNGERTFYKADGTAYSNEEIQKLASITLSTPTTSIGLITYNIQARYGFFESLLKAWPFSFYVVGLIFSAFAGIFTGATAREELGGTITAVSQIAEISKMGINSFLLLLPLLSMNLAVFNILPIPALDGARCVFVLIEWIFKKPVPRKVENIIHTVGLFILMGLVVFLDIAHFFF